MWLIHRNLVFETRSLAKGIMQSGFGIIVSPIAVQDLSSSKSSGSRSLPTQPLSKLLLWQSDELGCITVLTSKPILFYVMSLQLFGSLGHSILKVDDGVKSEWHCHKWTHYFLWMSIEVSFLRPSVCLFVFISEETEVFLWLKCPLLDSYWNLIVIALY